MRGRTYEALGFGSVVTGFPFLSTFGSFAPAFVPRRGAISELLFGTMPGADAAEGVEEEDSSALLFS